MRKTLFSVGLIAISCCNSAVGGIFQRDSTVKFKVIDFDGNPISNANVCVSTFKKWIPGDNFGTSIDMDIQGNTDTNGEVSVSFLCKSLQFSYVVKAIGYYGEGSYKDINSSKAQSDIKFARAGSGFTLRQTQFETNLVVRLKPIVNPTPMYVQNLKPYSGRYKSIPEKALSGVWGYDIKTGDWTEPYGKGKDVDFFVEYSYEHFHKDRIVDCALVFTNNVHDGFYIAKNSGTFFCSDYVANTNATYVKRLDFGSWGKKYKGNYATDLLDDNEYIVLRTRTKCDKDGRIVSAHYAKIYGPICFNGGFAHNGSYFNPNENDPNLEADTTVNLLPGGGKGFAP